ncbi:radical SAM family heme chaperone HemW [Desulfonauticus submarinus]
MLLYIHFPFCLKKCNYCAFFSLEYVPEMVELYLKGLEQEIYFWSRYFHSPRVHSIYIGGGTPSLLKEQELDRIVSLIYKNFAVERQIEFSLEVNPESCKPKDKLVVWKNIGVNRVSLGVQSFDPESLFLLGRIHNLKQVRESYFLLRGIGFKNINLDLMFGLPKQTVKRWLEELKQAIRLKPEHLSCYGFTFEQGTYLCENKKNYKWPDEEEVSRMYIYGGEYLEANGYIQYEISNFSRMGYRCLHNLGYWEGQDFLGLGPSAVSTINSKRWQNPANIKEYVLMVENGCLLREREKINRVKKINEFIMLSLRTTKGLNVREFYKLTGINFFKKFESVICLLHKNRLISIRDGYLRLTRTGMLLSDSIIPRFFMEEKRCLVGEVK